MKKKIRINFSDFYSSFDKESNDFINILREKYDVEISEKPDYLFYSTFGKEFLRYQCIRIFFTGECIIPDFNLCDYAIGFDHISFGDRYFRMPLYQLFQYRKYYRLLLENRIKKNNPQKFCSFVCSNDQGMKERSQMFEMLNAYKPVDSGGRFHNNVGGLIRDKFEFDKGHKFSIAFENTSYPGYTTEKIVEAFAAGTIPIYYGNPEIADEFNENAFINCHKFSSMEDAVNYIIRVDQDDTLYQRMKEQTILPEHSDQEDQFRAFLFNIMEQPYDKAFRRPCNTRTAELEFCFKVFDVYNLVLYKWYKKVKAVFRRIKNHTL